MPQVEKKATRESKPKILKCPICNYRHCEAIRTGIRSDPKRPVYACPNCLVHFLKPGKRDLREYYQEQYRKEHEVNPGQMMTPEQRFLTMRPMMTERESFFREHVPGGSLVLEVGCSSGYFLDCIQNDYTVYGNEWNPDDAAYVRDVGELPCEEGYLADIYPGKKFTAISAYHVLEHQPDPMEWIKTAKSRLIGGGWLLLEVPNQDDALINLYGNERFKEFWYRDSHPFYFKMETLAAMLTRLGFEAKLLTRQTYSIGNHINWLVSGLPMATVEQARAYASPVPRNHPSQGFMNRWWRKTDTNYRLALETLKMGDTIVIAARRLEI